MLKTGSHWISSAQKFIDNRIRIIQQRMTLIRFETPTFIASSRNDPIRNTPSIMRLGRLC